jgi:hypothetical protein
MIHSTQHNQACSIVAQASTMNSWNNFLAQSIVEYSLVFGCKWNEKIPFEYVCHTYYDMGDIWVPS